jgi:hypothetical protein
VALPSSRYFSGGNNWLHHQPTKEGLHSKEFQNEDGAFEAVRTNLDKIKQDLDDYLKKNQEQKFTVKEAVAALQDKIRRYKNSLDLAGDQSGKTELDQLQLEDKLKNAMQELSEEQVDLAEETRQNCQKQFETFRLNLELRLAESEIQNLQDPALKIESEKLADEVKGLISSGDLDQADQKLTQLKEKLNQDLKMAKRTSKRAEFDEIFDNQEPEPQIIVVSTGRENLTSGTTISFLLNEEALVKKGLSFPADFNVVQWNFGDGSMTFPVQNLTMQHLYETSGTYNVDVQLLKNDQPLAGGKFSQQLAVRAGQTEMSVEEIRGGIRTANWGITIAALLIAGVTGLIYLYMGKPFGSPKDYFLALLWGFGINESVKGFTEVYGRITQ